MLYPFSQISRGQNWPIWVLVVVMFGIWLFAQIISVPFVLLVQYVSSSGGGQNMAVALIFAAILVSSLAIIWLSILWAHKMEGKTLSDLGLRFDLLGWQQYRTGLQIGLLFAAALMMLVGLLQILFAFGGQGENTTDVVLHWSRLANPVFWLLLVALAILFAIQGGAEELLCRGWLLSSITQKKGLPIGIFLSSFLFAGMHVHYFFINGLEISVNQMLVGTVGLLAMFGMGLMLAMLALRDRSIMGAAGLHASFNFLAIGLGLTLFVVQGDEVNISAAFMQSFAQSTDLQKIEPPLVVQLVLSGLVAFYLYRRFGLPKPAAQ